MKFNLILSDEMRRWFCMLLMWAMKVSAHPHMWIDVEVEPVQNAQGQVVALKQKWVFDPLSSALLTEEIMRADDKTQQQHLWQALQDDMRNTLTDEGLYTFPRGDFAPLENIQFHLETSGLWLEAQLPLLLPTDHLRYQIYEPEYYVEILHTEQQPRQFGTCRLNIQAPNPDEDKYIQAAALDKNEKGDPNLGRFFAETVDVQCEKKP